MAINEIVLMSNVVSGVDIGYTNAIENLSFAIYGENIPLTLDESNVVVPNGVTVEDVNVVSAGEM